MPRLDKRGDPLAKIQGIIPAHDPPPSHEGNHKSALRKSRVLFPVRRTKMMAKSRITFGDVCRVRRDILPDGVTCREEAELLLRVDRLVGRADRSWIEWLT